MAHSAGVGGGQLYIFGYGSLVSVQSVARSLGRAVDPQRLRVAVLHGYRRDWEIRVPIVFEDGYACRGLFLDVAAHPGARVNGVLVPVTQAEFGILARREAQYEAVEVTRDIEPVPPPGALVRVFRGRGEFRIDHPRQASVLPTVYRELVQQAVTSRGREFAAEFQAGTLPPPGPERQGTYRFADPLQESATRPVGRGDLP